MVDVMKVSQESAAFTCAIERRRHVLPGFSSSSPMRDFSPGGRWRLHCRISRGVQSGDGAAL